MEDDLGPTRVYALVIHDDREAAIIVDTGSQHSFLSVPPGSPDPVAHAGSIELGCEERALMGRPFPMEETIDGLPVIGILGNDFFLERLREIDLVDEVIRDVEEVDHRSEGWAGLPYENLFDFLFVTATLDDVPVRLGFDTGAFATLWLGQEGQPGDQPVSTQDANGRPLTLFLGTATLEVGDEQERVVPVVRAPSFPSLEESNAALGGNIHGLLGISTVGLGKIRIDAGSSTIWLQGPGWERSAPLR